MVTNGFPRFGVWGEEHQNKRDPTNSCKLETYINISNKKKKNVKKNKKQRFCCNDWIVPW